MSTKARIQYYDALKALAILGVIFLHSFLLWNPSVNILNHSISNLEHIGRFGVPVFLLISGALLLGRDEDILVFYKKRVVRICYPLLFFILIAYIFQIYKDPLTAFWYCWMILGAYLAIPFINKMVQNSTIRELEYFLLIFVCSSLFYQTMHTVNLTFSLDLNFFITPISYLILGYYLSRKEFNQSSNHIVIISFALFVISTALKIQFGNFFNIYPVAGMYSSLDFGILELIQAGSLFLLVRFIYDDVTGILERIKSILKQKTVNGIIMSISRASYGMYLVHMLFLKQYFRPMAKAMALSNSQMLLYTVGIFFFLFLSSWIITVVLGKIPYLNKFSGYA